MDTKKLSNQQALCSIQPPSDSVASFMPKNLKVYEVLNKIQNVINTETAIPQFIYFVKNVEEMRKKWLQSELRCKELETKLQRSNIEKSTLQRQITELKIDIEMHHEKRQQAENERDKLLKQIETFKEILSDKKSSAFEDKRYLLSTYNIHNTPGINQNYNLNENNENKRFNGNCAIEDTGSIISDYTEDDIDLPEDYDEQHHHYQHNHNQHNEFVMQQGNEVNMVESNPEQYKQSIKNPPSASNLKSPRKQQQLEQEHNKRRSSGATKRNQRQSTSLTRNGESREAKRSRTRSTDMPKEENVSKAITAITTLKIGEDGRPITFTSEIKHNDPSSIHSQQNEINKNGNKMELSFAPRVKNRKKRPSREFLQRSVDESLSTEDSEIFWNGSEAVADEAAAGGSNINNVHIMTPIVETPISNQRNLPPQFSNRQIQNATPSTCKLGSNGNPVKSISANSIPLARKYKRAHLFKSQVILNSELCAYCDKRTKFGKMIMKCRECEIVVHNECKDLLQRPCFPTCNFPAQGTISDYAPQESPRIPPVLQMIINEIETRGLSTHEVGLYRVNGSDSQIKQLKDRLIKRHQSPDLRKINDVHVLCGFVKDFLNNLTEHLITYDSWFRFAKACEIQNENERLFTFQQAIQDLPEANRDTLSFLILHLQRIGETPDCKMPASNLAKVFGPSIVGNSSPNLPPAEIINEVRVQHLIVENLIKLSPNFYLSFIENMEQQQRLFKNPPKTPEVMKKSKTAVVLSSILGPAANVVPGSSNQDQQPPQSCLQRAPTPVNGQSNVLSSNLGTIMQSGGLRSSARNYPSRTPHKQ